MKMQGGGVFMPVWNVKHNIKEPGITPEPTGAGVVLS